MLPESKTKGSSFGADMKGVLGTALPGTLLCHPCVCEMFLKCRCCLIGILLPSKIDLSLRSK